MKDKKEEFKEIYSKYFDQLYSRALQLTTNTASAEDLVQETFLKGYKFYFTFQEGTNTKAWLFKIMQNVFINEYRSNKIKVNSLVLFLLQLHLFKEEKAWNIR